MENTVGEDQAFPGQIKSYGLTKREYFAGMALQAIYHQFDNELAIKRMVAQCDKECITTDQFVAEFAVETADALIAALNKGRQNESQK